MPGERKDFLIRYSESRGAEERKDEKRTSRSLYQRGELCVISAKLPTSGLDRIVSPVSYLVLRYMRQPE